jgi:hypothetical protein
LGGLGDLCHSVVNAVGPRLEINEQRGELPADIWRLRRLLRTALGQGVDQEIVGAIGWLAANGDRIERAVVAWLDLIEALVQAQERRYGPRPGLGGLKKDELKEVIRSLLVKERFHLPHIPDFLVPAFLDFFVDWAIDAVVLMENRHGMWDIQGESGSAPRVFWAVVRKWLSTVLQTVWATILRAALRIRGLFRPQTRLSPEVAAALAKVQREGLIFHASELISGAERVLMWMSMHRAQLVAAFELVLAAVHEAETFLELSGPEKKAYSRNLVLAVLDELGFEERTGLLSAVIQSLIGSSIEAAVSIFNRRGVFIHRAAA